MRDLNYFSSENVKDCYCTEASCYQEAIIKNKMKLFKDNISQKLFEYKHEIKLNDFLNSCEQAKKKFCALQTRFSFNGDKLIQIIDQFGSSFEICLYIDIDKEKNTNDQLTIYDILEKDRLNTFEPFKGNLVRITLVKENLNHFYCILSYHTAIMDYNSAKKVINFINEAYLKLINEKKSMIINNDLDEFIKGYKILNERKESNNKYWENKINKIDQKIELNVLNSKIKTNEVEAQTLVLTEEIF